MKLDVTRQQLEAIKELTDNMSAMIGTVSDEFNKINRRHIKRIDSMLKRNNLPPRDFN